jgi:hypothetical protein
MKKLQLKNKLSEKYNFVFQGISLFLQTQISIWDFRIWNLSHKFSCPTKS